MSAGSMSSRLAIASCTPVFRFPHPSRSNWPSRLVETPSAVRTAGSGNVPSGTRISLMVMMSLLQQSDRLGADGGFDGPLPPSEDDRRDARPSYGCDDGRVAQVRAWPNLDS